MRNGSELCKLYTIQPSTALVTFGGDLSVPARPKAKHAALLPHYGLYTYSMM